MSACLAVRGRCKSSSCREDSQRLRTKLSAWHTLLSMDTRLLVPTSVSRTSARRRTYYSI